ncbi:MAG: DUF342 domain-containing protein [Lachnospiraceae bacterium]|nr:DUF342 domain-containing protein [Lachnospiraceae bacterium]
MPQKNGYVQLVVKGDETYAVVCPPAEGGTPLNVSEVIAYFDRQQLKSYDLKTVAAACNNLSQRTEFKVGMAPFRPYNEIMDVDVSLDRMQAVCRFFPPSQGGSLMDEREICMQLQQSKIVFGVDPTAIKNFLADRVYYTDIVFAKGKEPRQGHDGKIEYYFNTSLNTKPKKNEDGTVDYHNLNTVSMVQEGQKLASLIAADHGDPGTDVMGNVIKPYNVREFHLDFGNNIIANEQRTEIYSQVTGHATVVEGKVFVSDVLEIPADVDNSTGDINYNGSVLIKGNVKSGFKVSAKGDIVVEGVVEGAYVHSEGQIIIKRGIHGMNKGVLEAKGNIISKFIESATVSSGGYIETEGIMHSKVAAATEIQVSGRKGIVAGGVIRAGNLVMTQVLGSEMGAQTVVEVGSSPEKKAKYNQLTEIIKEKKKELDTIKPILTTFSEKIAQGVQIPKDKMLYVQKLATSYKNMQAELEPLREELAKLHEEISSTSDARVKVGKTVYPGVTIVIAEVSLTTREPRSFCQFVREGGEVAVRNL